MNTLTELQDRITAALTDSLKSADQSYRRKPIGGVYELYKQYVATGQYPYLDDVTDWIAELYSIPADLHKQLHHEIYLASKEAEEDTTMRRAEDMRAKGYVRATTENIAEGKRYLLVRYSEGILGAGLQPEEKVRCVLDADHRLFLMPTRNTRRGYMVGGVDREYWVKEL
jgi:hypothetical protein